ncbi:hypothetical protein GYMLUDRAFT_44815 [Collybiopsis luxurians FD-317 M1]|uniref:Unplaced genomic scaffold GYMLUscaffold_33, whole genome shotgun sequence n=1 Tax=Collybiopsis luxurians FD-317 M1 TaxID=944289 RepID=A0A0D0B6N6_9AGAR|nr:hypothetical protein GYMLUDRAFT_44815 [Collybiopsis luxurians FD-317 M1]
MFGLCFILGICFFGSRCCACPQTKSARDDCFLKYGPDADESCKDLVQNHMACMRSLGFKI